MIAVALAAIMLVIGKGIWFVVSAILYDPYLMGLNSGLLTPGQPVVVREEYRATRAVHPIRRPRNKDAVYDWQGRVPIGDLQVAPGTSCVVTVESAGDEDDCYEGRPIAIKLTGGQHSGLEVEVPRRVLRKR
jgi:hypothetical protein